MYEGVISAIKCYQKKLGTGLEGALSVDNVPVWKCLLKGCVKTLHAWFVKKKIVIDPNA